MTARLCPFRQNAEWLRTDVARRNLLLILRHGELARGQRWNFRDAYSLIAELLVGQWSDFADATNPCGWVHQRVATVSSGDNRVQSALALVMRLYGNALFRAGNVTQAAKMFVEHRGLDANAHPISQIVVETLSTIGDGETTKSIREMLAHDYSQSRFGELHTY